MSWHQIEISSKQIIFKKMAGIAQFLGALLLIVFNLLASRHDDPGSVQSSLAMMSEQLDLTLFAQLMLSFGIWLAMIGSTGLYRSITGRSASWAPLGFYGIVVGAVLWTATFGLGSATVSAAADWIGASTADKNAAFTSAAVVSKATSGLETMSIITFWLALILLGIGMVRSSIYPKWLGWAAALFGVVMAAAVGIPKFFTGYTTTLLIIFGVLAILTTVWMLAAGIWLSRLTWWRRSEQLRTATPLAAGQS